MCSLLFVQLPLLIFAFRAGERESIAYREHIWGFMKQFLF